MYTPLLTNSTTSKQKTVRNFVILASQSTDYKNIVKLVFKQIKSFQAQGPAFPQQYSQNDNSSHQRKETTHTQPTHTGWTTKCSVDVPCLGLLQVQ